MLSDRLDLNRLLKITQALISNGIANRASFFLYYTSKVNMLTLDWLEVSTAELSRGPQNGFKAHISV